MSHHDKFSKESQDARRRDQHNAVHPEDKVDKPPSSKNQDKPSSNRKK